MKSKNILRSVERDYSCHPLCECHTVAGNLSQGRDHIDVTWRLEGATYMYMYVALCIATCFKPITVVWCHCYHGIVQQKKLLATCRHASYNRSWHHLMSYSATILESSTCVNDTVIVIPVLWTLECTLSEQIQAALFNHLPTVLPTSIS